MTMSPSINYAEQVLREEAERLAKLKEVASGVVSAAAAAANISSSAKENGEFASSIAKVNLKDDDDFPTLGKTKGVKNSVKAF